MSGHFWHDNFLFIFCPIVMLKLAPGLDPVKSRPIHHSSFQQTHPTISYQYATRNHTPASSKWPKWRSLNPLKGHQYATIQEISNRTHGPRTLKKPEFLIALASNLLRVRWDKVPINFWWKQENHTVFNMGVSKNSGTPKWMVYNGNPY